VIVSELGVRQD